MPSDKQIAEIQQRRARVPVSTPWRWGCWETTFWEREPAEMLERTTLEHAPKLLQFGGGVRHRDDHVQKVFQLAEPLDSYDLAEFLAKAPEDIDYLISALAAHEKAVAEARRETGDLRKVVLDHVSDLKGCVAAFEESEYRDSFARTTASIREAITELEAAAKGEQK